MIQVNTVIVLLSTILQKTVSVFQGVFSSFSCLLIMALSVDFNPMKQSVLFEEEFENGILV